MEAQRSTLIQTLSGGHGYRRVKTRQPASNIPIFQQFTALYTILFAFFNHFAAMFQRFDLVLV